MLDISEIGYPLARHMEELRILVEAKLPAEVGVKDTASPVWYEGMRWLPKEGRPPRYVWWPGDVVPGAPFKGDLGQYTAMATGVESVNVHSWGVDRTQAWTLRHNLVAMAKAKWGADVVYLGCSTQEAPDGVYGYGYVTRLSFPIPVISKKLSIARPETAEALGYIVVGDAETQSCGGI